MSARILRIELWRSNARWMALLLLVPLVATLGEGGRGITVIALDRRQLLLDIFALAMGVAAWYARRDRRSRAEELLATTARPRWQRVLPGAAALAIGAAVAYLISIAVDIGRVTAADGYLSAVAVPILGVCALWLGVGVSLGLAVGRWVPFFLIPPLVVIFSRVSLCSATPRHTPSHLVHPAGCCCGEPCSRSGRSSTSPASLRALTSARPYGRSRWSRPG